MCIRDRWKAFEFYRQFLHWYSSWYNPVYLEIGCASGELCAGLKTQKAVGIDILFHEDWITYMQRHSHVKLVQVSSDEYFELVSATPTFGLIFIDGDHSEEQVRRDVDNSLARLLPDGLICMHDTFPPNIDYTHEKWCGTAYKVAIELRKRRDLEVYTFPVTYGLTLVGKVGSEFPWIS